MIFSTLITIFTLFSTTGLAAYTLEDDYFEGNFFSHFTFFEGADPTAGFVDYKSYSDAQTAQLFGGGNTSVAATMKVDNSTVTPQGRPSVRITSNKSYNYGLVIADIEHMPASTCGSWPAFWMLGPNWPSGGEIDILEGVNMQTTNKATLHTGPGCSISNTGGFSGTLYSTDCASSNGNNTGCQIISGDTNTYGSTFNQNHGGVYAMEWTSSYISVWFFPRGSIPVNADAKANADARDNSGQTPDPSSWGTPMAHFTGDCDMSTAFVDQQIIFDTTFCGQWAGKVWGESCSSSTGMTCEDYVQNNPSVFSETYWTINALRVFKDNGDSAPPTSTYTALSTSVQYVTQPAAPTVEAPTTTPTTLVVATSSAAPYVPVVGPSGSVGAGSSPAEEGTGTGYAPVIGGDGTVGTAAVETGAAEGSWTTTSDGSMSYSGRKRNEDEIEVEIEDVERSARRARHLRFHKRGGKF